MNIQERDKIRKMRKDASNKAETAEKNKHEVVRARYQGWVDALEWVLMEV